MSNRTVLRRIALLGMLAPSLAGCATGAAAPAGQPVADPAGPAASLSRATVPTGPRQYSFAWTLEESGSRVKGRGVIRAAAPDRLRLDLFGPRNESYLSAALVGDDFRFHGGTPSMPTGTVLPSPALLWGALGVVRPPDDAKLVEARASDSVSVLRYGVGSGEFFQYRLSTGPSPRLEQVERIGPSGVLETVRLERAPDGALSRTRYRDWSAYRDLTLDVEGAEDVESFPESVWNP
jgi:hypothetical protein